MRTCLISIVFFFFTLPWVGGFVFAQEEEASHSLPLRKDFGVSVPSLDEDEPAVMYEGLVDSLTNAFEITDIAVVGEDGKLSHAYTLSHLVLGRVIFTPQETVRLQGTSLPYAQVSIFLAAPDVLTSSEPTASTQMKSEIFTDTCDGVGTWQLTLPGALFSFGRYALVGTSGIDAFDIETKWGVVEVAAEAKREAIDPLLSDAQIKVTSPTLATVAVLNTTSALPILGFVPYLAYLFSEPLSIIFRKRRKAWGIVYNSLTKQPIDLAVVRLYDASTRKLLQTRVSDSFGRYNFVCDPGKYYLEVQKQDYQFPSQYFKGKVTDSTYSKLYSGGEFSVVSDNDMLVGFNIPLDINLQEKPYRAVLLGYLLHQGQRGIALIGPAFALFSLILQPRLLFFFLFVLHVILYLLFRRFTYTPAVKTFGVISDTNKKPLKNVVVKLFDTEYQKLLDTKVTNSRGEYNFLVGENSYTITAEKTGYAQWKSRIIKIRRGADGIISEDIVLG